MSKKVFFENLDGLRFIAFFSIFLHHGIFSESDVVNQSNIFRFIEAIKKPAAIGVPFFFCLSGFLITYLLNAEEEANGRINLKNFYIRRTLRIWPLYYAILFFGFLVFPLVRRLLLKSDYDETANFWMYIFFLGNYDQIEKGLPYGVGLGVTWSLSVEEQYYLVWPAIFYISSQYKYLRNTFLQLFILLSILVLTFWNSAYKVVFMNFMDLACGAYMGNMAFLYRNGTPKPLENIPRLYIISVYALGISLIYAFYFGLFGFYTLFLARFMISVFMCFVIYEQTYCRNSFFKMSEFKIITYLGKFTYGFYLIHTISNFICHNILDKINPEPFFRFLLLQPAASFLLTIVFGYLSYHYYEKPFLNLKSKFES